MTILPRGRKRTVETLEAVADVQQLTAKPQAQWRLAARRFRGRKSGMVGLGIVAFLFLAALLAPLIAPYDPNQVLIGKEDVGRRDPPCVHAFGCDPATPQHILGTDGNVRDEFSRIVYGARVSLTIGFFVVAIALTIGSGFGALAGYGTKRPLGRRDGHQTPFGGRAQISERCQERR